MPRWQSVLLAAALGAAGALVHVPPAAATPPPVRLQAEHAQAGPVCGDGQSQYAYSLGSGETVVFLGGDNCRLTFGSTIDDGPVGVRWFGGGYTGAVCGVFVARRGGTEIARTARTCSTAGAPAPDWKVSVFPEVSLSPGEFQVFWDPETGWHDAHVDWVDLGDDLIVRQAENGTFGGSCDGQPVEAHPAPTGETVVTLGGAGCKIRFDTAGPNWVFEVRWYAGGSSTACGYFSAQYFGTEFGRTRRTCSTGGGLPDWKIATFGVNDMTSLFQVVWMPEGGTADAHVDWVSTAWTNGTTPAAEITPATVDFGMRAVGSATDRVVTVRGIGTGPMFLGESYLWYADLGTVFAVASDGCAGKILWPSQTCTVTARFSPQWAAAVDDMLTFRTSEGLHWADLLGDADGGNPASTISTPQGAILPSTGSVSGGATDERSGVNYVRVAFTNLAGSTTYVNATPTCNASRLSCTWSAPVPITPGRYTVNSRAYDLVGHVEDPGPSITITVV